MRSGLQSLLKETQRFGPPSGFIRLQSGLETLHQRGLLRRQREKANSLEDPRRGGFPLQLNDVELSCGHGVSHLPPGRFTHEDTGAVGFIRTLQAEARFTASPMTV